MVGFVWSTDLRDQKFSHGRCSMKRGMRGLQESLGPVFTALGVLVCVLTTLGMGPPQAERPPQPFFQDFFSGSVLLDGIPPP